MTIEVRHIEPGELLEYFRTASAAFLGDTSPESERAFEATEDVGRAIACFEDGEMVATLGAYPLDLAIPGASLPTSGTTHITVRPTHRRQGLLHRMMRMHFDQIRTDGEPLAALWASESGIYGRYGYGAATDLMRISIERKGGAFGRALKCEGRTRIIDASRAKAVLPTVYESLWRDRPGHFARSRAWWDNRQLLDAPWQREGLGMNRFAIYEEGGDAKGYAQYRVREHWDEGGIPVGELRIVELQGTPVARCALWRLLLDVDLVSRVTYWAAPVDSELLHWLAAPRQARRSLRDALWVRLTHVPRALEARSYAVADRIVFDVRDAQFEEHVGRFELEGGPQGGTCRRTQASADLELDVSDLGAVYLGGRDFRTLHRAGHVRGDPGEIARADRMFRTHVAPWCPEIF